MKRSMVCITTKSTLASLLFKGLAAKHTTVKWSIVSKMDTFAACIAGGSRCARLLSGSRAAIPSGEFFVSHKAACEKFNLKNSSCSPCVFSSRKALVFSADLAPPPAS